MKNLTSLLFVIVLGYACNSDQKQRETANKCNGLQTIEKECKPVYIEDKEVFDYSFVKSAKFVFLESKHPIGEIDRIIFHNDTIIIHEGKNHSVHLYGPDGNFLSILDKQGRGPEEYLEIDDITVDHQKKHVIVLDRSSQKALRYDFESNFVDYETFKGLLIDNIAWQNGKYYLQNASKNSYPKDYFETYHRLFCIKDSEDSGIPYFKDGNFANHLNVSNRTFYYNGSHLYYNNYLDPLIYEIKDTNLNALLSINFEGNESFIEYCREVSSFDKLPESKYAIGIDNLCITENFILFHYLKNKKKRYVLYNRTNKKILFHSSTQTSFSTELLVNKHIPFFNFPSYTKGNKFVSVIDPYQIKDVYNLNYSKKKRIVPENVLNYQYFQGVKQYLFIQ